MKTLVNKICRFTKQTDGAVAVFAALTMCVLFVAGGMSIDYLRAVELRARLQAAADAAALASAAGEGSLNAREALGRRSFAENLDGLTELPDMSVAVDATHSLVEASYRLPTTFMQLVGISEVPIKVTSIADRQRSGLNLDVYLLLDMSASMGIAADAGERQRLKALTKPLMDASGEQIALEEPDGCAFACHTPFVFDPPGKTIYQFARDNGVRLREDVLAEASASFINTLLGPGAPAGLRVGIIGFSRQVRWLARPSTSLALVSDALDDFPDNQRLDTRTEVAFPWTDTETRNESGSRGRIVVLVTDGLRGRWFWSYGTWTPVNQNHCNAIKNGGAELRVLEITYEEETNSLAFDTDVRPVFPQISPALQQCASPGKYYRASTPGEIEAVLADISDSIINDGPLKLTQ